jgi:hypothetical protein
MATEDADYESWRLGICKPVHVRQMALVSFGSATTPHYARTLPLRFRTHRLVCIQAHLPESFGPDRGSHQAAAGLMRHSDIRTTMNVSGKAVEESKRKDS